MNESYSKYAGDFLELASEQRLAMLEQLLVKKSKLSNLAKNLNSTKPEIHRNLRRLKDAGMISKDDQGRFQLSSFGHLVCTLIPSFIFVSQNKKYFQNHGFGKIPEKFIQRTGSLCSGNFVNGFTRVNEVWSSIFHNSKKYIFGILVEEPLDLIEPVVSKAKGGVQVNSIFSDSTIVPRARKNLIPKLVLDELIRKGKIERRMRKDVQVVVVLNEKEACVMFPTDTGEPDISKMFYGNDPVFHEWCLDYFRYCWNNSESFQERKLQ